MNCMIEDKIIEDIRSEWVAYGKLRNQREIVDALPDSVDLKALLEISYLASIKKEEGVSSQTRVVFMAAETVATTGEKMPRLDLMVFNSEIAFTPENLAKLAPAFDQELSALLVTRGKKCQYALMGLIFYGKGGSSLSQGQGSRVRPQALTLSVRAPGCVAIAYGDSVVGRFEGGEFVPTNLDPWGSSIFCSHIISIISQHEKYDLYKPHYWLFYRDCLRRLYSTAAEKGRGGTILWVPSAIREKAFGCLREGTVVTGKQCGSTLLRELIDRASVFALREDSKKMLAEYIDLLANLSCVDGALIIDDELKPLRFRSKIAIHNKWSGTVRKSIIDNTIPAEAFETYDTSRFGTRHSSAIDFVAECSGAVAFVVSEDGPVRTMMRHENSIVIWPDCLNTFFLDS